jgi:hypothetical protein
MNSVSSSGASPRLTRPARVPVLAPQAATAEAQRLLESAGRPPRLEPASRLRSDSRRTPFAKHGAARANAEPPAVPLVWAAAATPSFADYAALFAWAGASLADSSSSSNSSLSMISGSSLFRVGVRVRTHEVRGRYPTGGPERTRLAAVLCTLVARQAARVQSDSPRASLCTLVRQRVLRVFNLTALSRKFAQARWGGRRVCNLPRTSPTSRHPTRARRGTW